MFPRRVGILGVGLLGGSLGLACRRFASGCEIVGYVHNSQTGRRAVEVGAVDRASEQLAAAVQEADLVVLCTPVGLFAELLQRMAPHVAAGAIVTDVGSTKASICTEAARLLPPHARFVGSHPMAGSEKRGIEFARADLFQDAPCIVTPTPATDPASLAQIESFWQGLGMRTTRLAPDEHDRLIAEVSHVPHAVAAALMAAASDPAVALAGKGFFDTTRIASGDADLWRDILIDNGPHVRSALERLRGVLSELDQQLQRRDGAAVRAWLDAAAAKRDAALQGRSRSGGAANSP